MRDVSRGSLSRQDSAAMVNQLFIQARGSERREGQRRQRAHDVGNIEHVFIDEFQLTQTLSP